MKLNKNKEAEPKYGIVVYNRNIRNGKIKNGMCIRLKNEQLA